MSAKVIPYFFVYLLICGCVVALVRADEPKPNADGVSPPAGDADAISEWALAGVVWSEACLVNKVATEAARQGELTTSEMEELESIALDARQLIDQMKSFGWKRVQKTGGADGRPGETKKSTTLPDPEAVGEELAESMGASEPKDTPSSDSPAKGGSDSASQMLQTLEKRYDSETPDNRDDPGVDDELLPNKIDVDIDQYRVDDYIDETPREARNLADAREDGVEHAIAAASDEGIAGPVAGYISEREVQTRSVRRPYALDSIYDADDYDPDVDYNVENVRSAKQIDTAHAHLHDWDDDISPRNPAAAVTGEDELIAAMARGKTGPKDRTTDLGKQAEASLNGPGKRTGRPTLSVDSNWVSLHLLLNQNRWDTISKAGVNLNDVRAAVDQLRVTISTVANASNSERLRNLLRSSL